MKNIKRLIIMLLILIGISSSGFCDVVDLDNNFANIELEFGFNNTVIQNSLNFVEYAIDNPGEGFKGYIELSIPKGSSDYNYDNKKVIDKYKIYVDVTEGITKGSQIIYIPVNNGSFSRVTYKLFDDNDKEIAKNNLSNKVLYNNESRSNIGILSNNLTDYNHLSSKFNYLVMDKKILIEKNLIKNIDNILISEFDTKVLSDLNKKILKQWVIEGGNLIIASDEFVDVESEFEMLIKASDYEKKEVYKKLNIVTNNLSKGSVKLIDMPPTLKNVEGLDDTRNLFDSKLLKEKQEYQGQSFLFGDNIYRINRYINNIPSSSIPSLKLLLGILLVFVVLVGPLNYIVMNQMNKLEKMWISISSISLVFVIIFLGLGFMYGIKKPIINQISYLEYDSASNNMQTEIIMGIKSQKGKVEIEFPQNVFLYPFNENYNYRFKESNFNFNKNEKNSIDMLSNELWSMRSFAAFSKNNSIEGEESILYFENNKLTGKIFNPLDKDIFDVKLIYLNKYIEIDAIPAKSYLDIDVKTKDFNKGFTSFASYNGYNNYTGEELKRNEIIGTYVDNVIQNQDQSKVFALGFSDYFVNNEIEINGVVPYTDSTNLIKICISEKRKPGTGVYFSKGTLKAKIVEERGAYYQKYNDSLYGNDGVAEIELKAPSYVDVQKMEIKLAEIYDSSKYAFKIYNVENKTWEMLEQFSMILDEASIVKYYDQISGVKIEVKILGENEYMLPEFSVKGVVK